MKEIGSEFWDASPCAGETKYFLAGRTALDFIIRDILAGDKAERALLPSYCCETMIEPFIRNGIRVRFYDVYYHEEYGLKIELPEPEEKEIFYAMRYFGFDMRKGLEQEDIARKWKMKIEDRTHSWNAPPLFEDGYDYVSYRKWAGLAGIASAAKKKEHFIIPQKNTVNKQYGRLRKAAFKAKKEFIESGQGKKETYLQMFRQAEEVLNKDYVGYMPDSETFQDFFNMDVQKIKRKRRENAAVLMDGLRKAGKLPPVYENLQNTDVPLFVPVLVPADRDALRAYLIENQIYCPVHWPLSPLHKKLSERAKRIYYQELSLPCDQRYEKDDMEKILCLIEKFYT